MDTRVFDLFELVDWLEDVLDDRANYVGDWHTIFATGERAIEMHITATEIWFGAVSNYNLTVEERITPADELLLAALRWDLEGIGGPAPKWVRSFPGDACTAEMVKAVLRAFTLVYLPAADSFEAVPPVAVGRGMFTDYANTWDSAL